MAKTERVERCETCKFARIIKSDPHRPVRCWRYPVMEVIYSTDYHCGEWAPFETIPKKQEPATIDTMTVLELLEVISHPLEWAGVDQKQVVTQFLERLVNETKNNILFYRDKQGKIYDLVRPRT